MKNINDITTYEVVEGGHKFKGSPTNYEVLTKEEALETVLDFVERWNKGDEEQEVAEAVQILQEWLNKWN